MGDSGPFPWDDMLSDTQNEVLWIMQRGAMAGDVLWVLALAMLRLTCKREWARQIPPFAGQANVVELKLPSLKEALVASVQEGHYTLLVELRALRAAQGKHDHRSPHMVRTICNVLETCEGESEDQLVNALMVAKGPVADATILRVLRGEGEAEDTTFEWF